MQNAETTLAIVRDRGSRGLSLEDVYRRLYNPDLYLRAYGRLYKNAGAMTKGVTEETVDGMSLKVVGLIIEALRLERWVWAPARRLYIPKSNGKRRPLGLPTWSDKLLQEVMRSLLDAYYEPQFSPSSHGFRPGRGCHTALRDIFHAWTGTKWFIEGDIKGCFDNIDHQVLLSILGEKIRDNRFLILVGNMLEAGYLEADRKLRRTLSGTPQGGVISPILANIYLDRLDRFVAQTLIPEFDRGPERRSLPEYQRIKGKVRRARERGASPQELAPLLREFRKTRCSDPFDPGYRRLRYIRYADDFLLGFAGPKDEAVAIKERIGEFLRESLKLELSPEKTLITHALTDKARFLGYEVSADGPIRRRSYGQVTLRLPAEKLENKVTRYLGPGGKSAARPELTHSSDFTIVAAYGLEYRGIVQYYAYARNRWWLGRLHWVMKESLLKTLAAKHKSTVTKMARRFAGRAITAHGVRKCIEVVISREGKEPLIARFGGISLRMDPVAVIEDRETDLDRVPCRNELIARLLADECELCGSRENVVVHHVKKLADLKVEGRRDVPAWKVIMSARRRKTLVVCSRCHWRIHTGQPVPVRRPQGADVSDHSR